ncbi:MAG TPA: hypothetical protein DGT21_05320 [Armatimonadetes bacterium]|nr:hypothetical protein [Armatimonadota bacterium]
MYTAAANERPIAAMSVRQWKTLPSLETSSPVLTALHPAGTVMLMSAVAESPAICGYQPASKRT